MRRVQSVLVKREKFTYDSIPEMIKHRFTMRALGWKTSLDERLTVTYEKEYRNESTIHDSNHREGI
jgi:hypothetical protein